MARAVIKPELQLQRLNSLEEEMKTFEKVAQEILCKRPSEKSWAMIEVIEHMVVAHAEYFPKINEALEKIETVSSPVEVIKSRRTPSFLIKRFPPKESKIRFKMKTMKRFYPVFDVNQLNTNEINQIFLSYHSSITHLNNSVKEYRNKDVKSLIFSSAVGSWVKFNVAEAVEFIICHNERHHQQLKNTHKKVT